MEIVKLKQRIPSKFKKEAKLETQLLFKVNRLRRLRGKGVVGEKEP
jgi:hypothetical protein